MFKESETENYEERLKGVFLKTLIHGERTHMTKVLLQKGAVIPSHDHNHEQTGYIISGRIELTIYGDKFRVNPGDRWCIHGSITHSVIAIKESVSIDVNSPIRRDS